VPRHLTTLRTDLPVAGRTAGATKEDLLELLRKCEVRFLRLQFTDITGIIKNVEVPRSQFEKALAGDITFEAPRSRASSGSRSRT